MNSPEKKYFKEIKDIEKRYKIVTSGIQSTYPRAKNFKTEKKKFFMAIADDKRYDPKFEFQKSKITLDSIKDLENIDIDLSNDLYGFKFLYKELIESSRNWLYCIMNWGDYELSTKYSLDFYDRPSAEVVKKALKFCLEYQTQKVKFTRLTPRKVGNRLQKFTKELTGDDIKVSYEALATKANISASKKLLKIDPDSSFTSLDLKRLKAHEIGVHYLRYFNGNNFGIRLLKTGTSRYIETEEGLAVFNEDRMGVLSNAQMHIYAGRVLAVHYSLSMGFYDVYQKLRELGFDDEVSFAITYRAKRNLSDTSKEGGFTKDYVYFSGYHKVLEHSKKNDIRDLFIGKIKIEDLEVLKDFIEINRERIEFPDYDLS